MQREERATLREAKDNLSIALNTLLSFLVSSAYLIRGNSK